MNKLYMLLFLCPVLLPFTGKAQVPAGASAGYGLNGSAADATGNSNNGALSGTVNSVNRFGTASSAVSFIAVTSSGTLPASLVTAMQNDFSIGFWFKTAAIAPTGTQWFNGISLVDAETAGATNDWGICLIDGGKVCFGIGNPDMTIKSTAATYNNNAWHFVTATRNKTAGTIILYIDGAQVATTTGTSTAALSAPAVIGLGRSSAVSTGNYTGTLDDIIGYNRVLTSTEASNMYTALTLAALPLQWLSFSAAVVQNNVKLQWTTASEINQDYFTVEASADAIRFNTIARTQGYSYTDPNKSGDWYYRIRQTDQDRNYTFSKTIKVTVKQNAGISLQENPARNSLVVLNNTQMPIRLLEAIDASGRVLMRKQVNNGAAMLTVDISRLQPGYYQLRVDDMLLPFIRQ